MKSCVCQSCCHGDGDLVMWKRGGVAGCTHPVDCTHLEAHRNHGRYVYYVYLWMNDLHLHDVLSDQNGPPLASQTSQFPLGPNDRLFKNQYKY